MTEADPLRSARAFVNWVGRHGPALWLLALMVSVPALVRTASLYMHLQSDLENLLPVTAPSVLAIDELRSRMPGVQYLGVIVDSGSADKLGAAERLLDDLAERVRQYPTRLVREVRTGDRAERRFVEDHAGLYASVADMRTVRDRIEVRRDYEVGKETGTLLDEDAAPPPLNFDDVENRYRQWLRPDRRFDDDRFSNRALHLTLLLIQLGDFETGKARGEELLQRVRADVVALGGLDRYAPGMRLGFTGDVAISVEETNALLADLSLSSIVVIALVVGVILLYYRWWPAVVVLVPPLFLAAACAFGLASLPPLSITALNSNTAFLGSIIVGNGINFGIVLLARYLEERRARRSVQDALTVAVWGARKGTLSAALAASISYGSLALTDFRGFRQFGFIGGIGMVLSWVGAFVLMPPLIVWMDRGRREIVASQDAPRFAPMAWVAKAVVTRPRTIALVSLALLLLAIGKVSTLDPNAAIETDFSRLRRADTWQNGEGYWGRRMEALLGAYLTPTVILTDDLAQARAIAADLRGAAGKAPLSEQVASVRTVDDVVPPAQTDKLAVLESIRADLTPKIRSLMSPEQLQDIDRLLGEKPLSPITPAEVPAPLLMGLRERDGTLGREVLVYPRPSKSLWQGAPLAQFVAILRDHARTTTTPGQPPARVAGSLPLSADILASVRRDGLRASVVALLGVIAVVMLLLKGASGGLLVVASLVIAVTWLLALSMGLGVRVNFANFIAFPITFGIGVDYAVNVVTRDEQANKADIGSVVRTTGGAVTLCSLTTIIGYSSLLMAENRGLFSFGMLAVMGEICCLSTAVVALPAWLRWGEVSRESRPLGASQSKIRPH